MNWNKVLIGCGVLMACGVARADINYTQQTTMPANPAYKGIIKRAVKPNLERNESVTDMGVYKMSDVTIRQCEQKQTIKLNDDLKIYAIVPDADNTPAATNAQNAPRGAAGDGEQKTGKMVMTYAVQDLGVEEVAGFKCRHWMIDMTMESSGCAGNGTTKQKYELWVSDIREPSPCPSTSEYTSVSQAMSRPDCKIEVVQKGDSAQYLDIRKGLVLRQKIYNGDQVLMVQEVTSLSQAKLGDELFVIPADYKKVSPEDFEKQKQAAMMKAMMGGHDKDND